MGKRIARYSATRPREKEPDKARVEHMVYANVAVASTSVFLAIPTLLSRGGSCIL